MLRIHRIEPVGPGGGGAMLPRATPGLFGAGTAQAVGEIGTEIERRSLGALDAFARAEGLQQRQDEALDLAVQKGTLEQAFSERKIALQAAGTDPDLYAETLGTHARDLVEQTVAKLKYPASAPRFLTALQPWLAEQAIHAKFDAFKMKNGLIEAGTDAEIERQTNLAVTAPTPEDRDRAAQTALGLATQAYTQLVYDKGKYVAQVDKARTQIETGRLDAAAKDPESNVLELAAEGRASRYLPAHVQFDWARATQARRDADARREEVDLERSWKASSQATIGALFREAAAKTLTKERLDGWAKTLRMTREDYSAILTEMERPAREEASDPDALERASIAMHRARPTLTEAELRAFSGLNLKDRLRLLDTLTSRRQHIEERGESQAMQAYREAEDLGRARLGIPTLFERLDANRQKAWDGFLRELDARAFPLRPGAEPPLRVAEEILPRYQGVLGEDARLTAEQLKPVLRYGSHAELDAARRAGRIGEPEYRIQRDYVTQMADLLRQQADQEQDAAKRRAAEEARKGFLQRWFGIGSGRLPSVQPPGTGGR